jgi:hypothetical protein
MTLTSQFTLSCCKESNNKESIITSRYSYIKLMLDKKRGVIYDYACLPTKSDYPAHFL